MTAPTRDELIEVLRGCERAMEATRRILDRADEANRAYAEYHGTAALAALRSPYSSSISAVMLARRAAHFAELYIKAKELLANAERTTDIPSR